MSRFLLLDPSLVVLQLDTLGCILPCPSLAVPILLMFYCFSAMLLHFIRRDAMYMSKLILFYWAG